MASSQANESVNNMIAHKAPKNICLSRTAAADFRVASAICTKNDDESSILNIKTKLSLSTGSHTDAHAKRYDHERLQRAKKNNSKEYKLRIIELAKKTNKQKYA